MKLYFLIPVIVAILLFAVVQLLKKKMPNDKLKYWLLIIGIFCGVFSIIAISVSAYYSGDKTQLYKVSLPAIIIIIAMAQINSIKKKRVM
jgi:hypothetical protein